MLDRNKIGYMEDRGVAFWGFKALILGLNRESLLWRGHSAGTTGLDSFSDVGLPVRTRG